MIHEHQKNASNIPASSPAFIPPGVQITRMDVYNIIKRHRANQGEGRKNKADEMKHHLEPPRDNEMDGDRLRLPLHSGGTALDVSDARRDADAHSHAIDPAATATYPILPTPAQLAPATPEEAVSFAQQWSDLIVNLNELQPSLMEYALTTGTRHQNHTTAEWSQAVAQLTQAWYVASNLVGRPVLPVAHNPAAP